MATLPPHYHVGIVVPDVAAARGVRDDVVGTAFLVVVALATTAAVPVVGALLVFSLLVAPAAAARCVTRRPAVAVAVGERGHVVLVLAASHAPAGAALDAPELLDVDVQQFARPLALVALSRVEPEPAQAAHTDPRQDP